MWKAGGGALKLSELSLLAPIPAPRRNILCIGLNYVKHGQEGAAAFPRGVRSSADTATAWGAPRAKSLAALYARR